jgi:hypothetical protein
MRLANRESNAHAFAYHPPSLASGDCLHFITADSRRVPSALKVSLGRMRETIKKEVFILIAYESVFLALQDAL